MLLEEHENTDYVVELDASKTNLQYADYLTLPFVPYPSKEDYEAELKKVTVDESRWYQCPACCDTIARCKAHAIVLLSYSDEQYLELKEAIKKGSRCEQEAMVIAGERLNNLKFETDNNLPFPNKGILQSFWNDCLEFSVAVVFNNCEVDAYKHTKGE
jgi:hypothetical protein